MRTNDNAVVGLVLAVIVLSLLTFGLLISAARQISLNRELTVRIFELERVMKIQVRINDAQLAAMVSVGLISHEIFQRYTTPPGQIED